MAVKKILILGAGNIGSLISTLLAGTDDYQVVLASKDITSVLNLELVVNGKILLADLDALDTSEISNYVSAHKFDAIVSALPYSCNKGIATVAVNHGIHYFDLTEDVNVKNHLMSLSDQSKGVLMPQCGLAPGFINIVGHDLMTQFDTVENAKLRVGALPQMISNSLRYSLTWSTNGLVNEYGNPCEAVVEGSFIDNLQPLEGVETLLLEGVEYEAFNTSGGLGTLAETWNGKVRNLNYKTLRYPGHAEKIKFLMFDLKLNENRHILEQILENAVPTTQQDVIVIYSSVNGIKNGKFVELSYSNFIYPKMIHGRMWTGIQVSTAAGACAAVDIVLNRAAHQHGFMKQETISLSEFLSNRFGQFYK